MYGWKDSCAGSKVTDRQANRLRDRRILQTDRQAGGQTITQSRWRTNHFDCEYGCIFTQVAVCIREIEPLPKTIILPLVFCRSRLWHNAIAFIYFIHFSSQRATHNLITHPPLWLWEREQAPRPPPSAHSLLVKDRGCRNNDGQSLKSALFLMHF